MKYFSTLFAALILVCAASIGDGFAEQKGPNGGPMEDIADVDAELIIAGSTVTINVFDEDKRPVATKGFAGAALIVAGSDRETVNLVPHGENSLQGTAKKPVAANAAVTLTLKTASGKSGQAKFKR